MATEMTPAIASAILKDLHDRFGEDAFVKLVIHACADDHNDDVAGIELSDLDSSDVAEWCDGLKESVLGVLFD